MRALLHNFAIFVSEHFFPCRFTMFKKATNVNSNSAAIAAKHCIHCMNNRRVIGKCVLMHHLDNFKNGRHISVRKLYKYKKATIF